ncbi:MAG: glycosyltransferase family 2 protein [Deltaproteobacteria bacterium]|nr:glycosyltransferase family 2 protein [Deltaproteobacteria bacterium]MBN2686877.1 glycosyltransferase family 2 protein [Deltaproteobacteria bacterium]
MKLSVIIVSYRVCDLLESSLRSIYENGFHDAMEVIVIDNASGDGTVEKLSGLFPFVRWIQNDENVGFAPAVNQAVEGASGEFLLLLNPDMRIVSGVLVKLIQFMEGHGEIGAVGPGLMLPNGEKYVSVMPFLSWASVFFYETRLNRLFPFYLLTRPYSQLLKGNKPFRVDSVEGSFMLLRREAWQTTGGFDSHYFFGIEEMDLAWQLKRSGYETWFHPLPGAFHEHSGSTGGKRQGIVNLSIILATLYFLRKNRRRNYYSLLSVLLVISLLKLAISLLFGWAERTIIFKEAVKALLGLRPMYITHKDKGRWNDD